MRKTLSYFIRKLVVLQKVTTMAWLKDKVRRKHRSVKPHYKRMYFRYESLEEVKQKFTDGEVLSGLTTNMDDGQTMEDHFWIVYGKHNDNMSIVPIIRKCRDEKKKLLCGMTYHQFRLGEAGDIVTDLTRRELDELTSDYCLLFPYRESTKPFESLYGVVFSDWDVIDGHGKKRLPELCPVQFLIDCMSL